MYIEFTLPSGAGGMAAGYTKYYIEKAFKEWHEKYQIPYKVKTQNYRLKITFDNPEHYSFWALTWESKSVATSRWRLVEPMNPPKSID